MDEATYLGNFQLLAHQQAQSTMQRFRANQWSVFPQCGDDTAETGFDRHYIYHTAWAARRLLTIAPRFHVDFGSSLYFAGIASALVPVRFYDIRPPALKLPNLDVLPGDLTSTGIETASLPSVSCMHVIEHIGLGRYGEAPDFDGDMVAMGELSRIVAPGGSLLFVVPVGQPLIAYNAHRIYSYGQILNAFSYKFDLVEFALIPDAGDMVVGAPRELADRQKYACGCFHFIAREDGLG